MTTEERLARLERQNRWMKAAGAVLVLVFVGVLLAGAGQDKDKPKVLDEVRAKAFVVVDKDGKDRASLSCQKDGASFLGMRDQDGKVRVSLRVRSDGSP